MSDARTTLPERNLDVLRAFAVSSVLADHLYMSMSGGRFMWLAYWLGQAGVLAFFVHTSLVLMSSIERLGGAKGWVGRFYIRRAFRIYPLAIAAILFVLVLRIGSEVPVAQKTQPFVAPGAIGLLSNLLLVQNLTGSWNIIRVLWSLPIEVQMYVVLPLCYVVARYRPRLLPLLFALGIAGAYLRSADIVRGLWRFDTLFFVPCFLSGVLAYAILRRQRPGRRLPSAVWLVLLPLLFAGCAILLVPHASSIVWDDHKWMQWGYCLLIGLMVPAVAELRESPLTRAAHTVAKYSYGVYLLHTPVLWLTFASFKPAVALIVILPVVAYHAIEEPCIRLGARVSARQAMTRSAPDARPAPS
ncbi:MAG TPA: acyltransferase [Gemmatimonadaceae bacterium]|nr:acyltransferase [Gemmatimonadaceae bacterium]